MVGGYRYTCWVQYCTVLTDIIRQLQCTECKATNHRLVYSTVLSMALLLLLFWDSLAKNILQLHVYFNEKRVGNVTVNTAAADDA